MYRIASIGFFGMLLLSSPASALCSSYPNTLTNGTTADGGQVMANFNCAALTSGSTISGLTLTGTTSLPGSGAITSSGSLGIGTNSPAFPLDVHGSGKFGGQVTIANGTVTAGSQVYTALSIGPASGSAFGSNGSAILLNSVTNAGILPVAAVASTLEDGGGGGSNYSGQLVFSTKNTTDTGPVVRVTVVANGSVGIGTTSPSYTLHVNGSVAGTSAYNNLSDARLKTDIHPISDALEIVSKLQGVSFSWRKPEDRMVGRSFNLPVGEPQVGFIAQDLKKVLPQAVSVAGGKDAVMSVAESKVVPVLVEAVKELEAANRKQTATLGQQASEMKDLRTQLRALQRRVEIKTAQR